MIGQVKRFLNEEEGLGTVEIVIIVAVLVGLALIFRKQIYALLDQLFDRIFRNAGTTISSPESSYTDKKNLP